MALIPATVPSPWDVVFKKMWGWLSWVECHPIHQQLAGLIPSRGMYGK